MPRACHPYPSDLTETKSGLCWSLCWPPPKGEAVHRSGPPSAHRGRRRFLPAQERLRLANAAPRIPTMADGVLPLLWKWRRDGRLRRAHDRLREAVGQAQGREPETRVVR